jgi:hypothetical protein
VAERCRLLGAAPSSAGSIVPQAGFEPATPGLSWSALYPLSYWGRRGRPGEFSQVLPRLSSLVVRCACSWPLLSLPVPTVPTAMRSASHTCRRCVGPADGSILRHAAVMCALSKRRSLKVGMFLDHHLGTCWRVRSTGLSWSLLLLRPLCPWSDLPRTPPGAWSATRFRVSTM